MLIDNIVKETVKNKQIDWTYNPRIGWLAEADTIVLYYGTTKSNLQKILREGIYANDKGYVLCSLEPNTALVHARMRSLVYESSTPFSIKEIPVVFKINFPYSFYSKMVVFEDPNKRMEKNIYESWGKSDSEYYALINVGVPNHISVKYINGYMVK